MGGKRGRKTVFLRKRFWKLTFVYFILFIAIFGLIDYYALMVFNFLWFVALSAILALMAAYWHLKDRRHDHVDEVVDEWL